MILSKKTREGYLLLDHTASPGVPGLAPKVEVATIRCSHCERQVIRNPARERERHWCPGCNKYVCDGCEVLRRIHGCRPFDQVIEKVMTKHSNLGVI